MAKQICHTGTGVGTGVMHMQQYLCPRHEVGRDIYFYPCPYVHPSHFFSTVLVSATPPKVFDAGT